MKESTVTIPLSEYEDMKGEIEALKQVIRENHVIEVGVPVIHVVLAMTLSFFMGSLLAQLLLI